MNFSKPTSHRKHCKTQGQREHKANPVHVHHDTNFSNGNSLDASSCLALGPTWTRHVKARLGSKSSSLSTVDRKSPAGAIHGTARRNFPAFHRGFFKKKKCPRWPGVDVSITAPQDARAMFVKYTQSHSLASPRPSWLQPVRPPYSNFTSSAKTVE